jgi:regulatory protein
MTKDRQQKAFSYALRLIKRRRRSRKELEDRLKKKKYPKPIVIKVLNELDDKNYIDDLQFAKAWVHDRMHFNPKSPRLLKLELEEKGISSKIIDSVLKEVDSDYNFKKITFDLAKRKFESTSRIKNKIKRKRRIFDYLKRRGFSYNHIYNAINKLFNEK